MGKLPPSPCKCCGSKNHWDKECPDYYALLERAKCSANLVEIWPDDKLDRVYASAYSILLNERLTSHMIVQPNLNDSTAPQDFKQALPLPQSSAEKASKSSVAEVYNISRRVTMEEVEDEDQIAHLNKPKSLKHLLEKIDEIGVPENEDSERVEPNFRSPPTTIREKRVHYIRFTRRKCSSQGSLPI